MIIDSEDKAKVGLQCCIGTALLCTGNVGLGILCFVILIPWTAAARVGVWLVEPILKWRMRRADPEKA